MIYKIGSRGGEVLKIQKAVGVSADGLYGARTKEAVAVWQSAHGLTADGIVGYKTWVRCSVRICRARLFLMVWSIFR